MKGRNATQAWLFCVDNMLLDVTYEIPDNKFWNELGIEPGLQYTATNEKLTQAALKVLELDQPDNINKYGAKKMDSTPGGCALNTARAANFYFKAL